MTQADPSSSILIFKSVVADEGDGGQLAGSPDYLLCRERDERSAAKRATSGIARSIHQELAQAYAHLREQVAR